MPESSRVRIIAWSRLPSAGAWQGELSPHQCLSFARVGANFEHALDLVLGKGFYIHFLKTWDGNTFHWILKSKLGMRPREKSTQGDPDVSQ